MNATQLTAEMATWDPSRRERLTETLRRMFPAQEQVDAALAGYTAFRNEIVRLEMDFAKTGVYAPKTEDDTYADTYANSVYMRTRYLPGLLLSWWLWPQQWEQVKFFEREFLPLVKDTFYDVGIGTGLYSRLILQETQVCGVGYDISRASLAFAKRHIEAFGLKDRMAYRLEDVREDTPLPLPFVLCCDVIEHLTDPVVMLHSLCRMTAPDGVAFITTAINAPNRDHVFLLRSVAEARALVESGGFTIKTQGDWTSKTGSSIAAFVCGRA